MHNFCLYFAAPPWSIPRKVNCIRGLNMNSRFYLALCTAILITNVASAEEFQLPAEVTPALRAACERDVRRLGIGENPSVAKVKSCVAVKFMQLGRRCQVQLALAGYKR